MNNGPIIGIDLGTTNSCAAIYPEKIIPVQNGDRTIPSVIGFPDPNNENKILVGKDAIKDNNFKKIPLLYDSKRFIGRNFNDPEIKDEQKYLSYLLVEDKSNNKVKLSCKIGNKTKEFYPEEVSAEILKQIKINAEKYLKTKIERAVITVPAYFNNSQRESTKKAGEIAGFTVERIINEPTAAALAYGLNKYRGKKKEDSDDDDDEDETKDSEKKILVFDLGGGTFDVSILNLEKNENEENFVVIGTGGNNHLGGRDFDKIIYDLIIEEISNQINIEKYNNTNSIERIEYLEEKKKEILNNEKKFMELCESYKIQLSDSLGINNVFDLDISIYRSNFEFKIKEKIEECMDIVKKTLKDAKINKEDISHVILIGGSTKIPKIKETLENMFTAKKIYTSINPDEAVAIGASIQAAIIQNVQSENIMKTFLFDSTPLDLGLEVENKKEDSLKMGVIIKKNTEIPYEYKRTIRTTHDNQERATIKIYEGNYKELEKNHFLGKFTLTNLPRRPAGKVEMELTYKIDSDSILTVTAQEISNPENKKFIQIINTNNTLTNEQVDELREKSEKYIHDFTDENENIISKICNLRNKYNNNLKDEKKKEIIQKIFNHLEKLISLIKINENNNQTNYEKYYIYISYLFKEMSIFLSIKAISNEDLEFIKNKIKFYIDSLLNLNDKLELNNLLDLISNFYIVLKNENINNIYIFSLLYIFDIFSKKGQKLFENEKYDESYKILNVIVQQIEIKLIGKNNEITDENILSLYRFAKKYNDYISTIYLRKKKTDEMYEISIKGDYVITDYLDLVYISYIKILIDNKENIIKNINDDCLEKLANVIFIKTGKKMDDNKNEEDVIKSIKDEYINNLSDIFNSNKKNKNPNVLYEEIEKFTKKIMDYNITKTDRTEKNWNLFKNDKNLDNAKRLIRAIQQDFQRDRNINNFQNEMKVVFEKISIIANQFDEKIKKNK